MGFDGVEFAGFDGLSAEQLRARLDEVGMVCIGSHTGIERLLNNLDEEIAYHKVLGASYINCPGTGSLTPKGTEEEKIAGWKAIAASFNEIGKKIAAAGMGFCYHKPQPRV